jgi:tetratricopeptide (TPR) repeat protein
VLSRDRPDEDLAALAAELARTHFFAGDIEPASERLEFALELAESLWIPEVLSEALNTKSLLLAQGRGRNEEAEGLLRHALRIALDNDVAPAALRAYFNLSHTMISRDRIEEAQAIDREGQALARRRGDRLWELFFYNHLVGEHHWLGEWDEMLELAAEVPIEDPNVPRLAVMVAALRAMVHGHRGDLAAARADLEVFGRDLDRGNLQEGAGYDTAEATLLLAEGRAGEAVAAADAAYAVREPLGLSHPLVKLGYLGVGEASLALGDLERVGGLVAEIDAVPRGQRPPFLAAQAARFDAHLALARGDQTRAEQRFQWAVASLRELSYRFWLAVTLLEYAELPGNGEAAAAAAEARQLFERMGATPWIERSDALLMRVAEPVG